MAKSIIIENTSEGRRIHHVTRRGDDIHRRYGLWIIGGSTNRAGSGSFVRCPWRSFDFYNLSHFLEGGGRCAFENGGERVLETGECVVLTPGVVHRYGSPPGAVYIEDALRFQGPVADMLFNAGVLRPGVCPLGPVRRINAITEAARDPSVSAQINANGALQALLLEMYNLRRRRRSGGDAMEEVVAAIKRFPERWWTVGELAEMAGMSDFRLRRNFLRHTGLLPKDYIERLKMQRAAELLQAGCRIAEAAERLGYRDMYHFARRFKIRFGISPGRFRTHWN